MKCEMEKQSFRLKRNSKSESLSQMSSTKFALKNYTKRNRNKSVFQKIGLIELQRVYVHAVYAGKTK